MAISVSRPVKFLVVGGVVTLIDLGLTYFIVLVTGTRVVAVSVRLWRFDIKLFIARKN